MLLLLNPVYSFTNQQVFYITTISIDLVDRSSYNFGTLEYLFLEKEHKIDHILRQQAVMVVDSIISKRESSIREYCFKRASSHPSYTISWVSDILQKSVQSDLLIIQYHSVSKERVCYVLAPS